VQLWLLKYLFTSLQESRKAIKVLRGTSPALKYSADGTHALEPTVLLHPFYSTKIIFKMTKKEAEEACESVEISVNIPNPSLPDPEPAK
jgi:hypothetical protein